MKKAWFRRKKYGYGWGLPATWQGWIVFIIYLAFVIWNVQKFQKNFHASQIITSLILPTVIFIAILYLTSEKPRWKWGNKNKKS